MAVVFRCWCHRVEVSPIFTTFHLRLVIDVNYSVPSSSQSMSTQPVCASRSLVNHGASFSVPSSHQSNFHGSSPCINPVDRSHLDNARLSSQAPIYHTGDGNYFSSASPQNPMFPKSIELISHSLAVFHMNIIVVLHNRLFQEHMLMLVMYHHPSSFNPVIIPVHQLVAGLYLNLISFNLVIIPVRHLVAGLYLNFVSSLVKIFPIFLDYPSWRYSFQTLIKNSGISNSERIYYLGCYVKGTALETIKGYLVIGDDNSYHAALSLLAERYGNHLVLCNAFRLKLDSWSKNSDFDRAGLRSYADFLNQCLSARNKFHLNILDDEFKNDKMLEKLPSWMRGKCDPRRNIMSFSTFREFVNFVTRESDLWIDPMPLTSSRSPSRSTTSSYQGWQPAFTVGIIRRLKPDKAGPDNTPKSGLYYFSSLFLH